MASKEMQEKLNKQLNLEFYSYYQYLSMSAHCRSLSLNGFGNWFSIQAEEERTHAMKIYDYLLDVDGQVDLLPLAQPPAKFNSVLELFEKTLAHEKIVTKSINELVGFALKDNDYAAYTFLQWFVTEQIEEESIVRDIVESLKLVKNSGEGLLMIDRELGVRKAEEN